jgi:small subunit ribosomal protein S1
MPQSNAPESPEASPVDTSFADILNEYEQSHHARGETLQGTVVSVTADAVFVDIGRKTDGVLPVDPAVPLQPGQKLIVSIRGRDEEGNYQLSTIRVETPKDWTGLEADGR